MTDAASAVLDRPTEAQVAAAHAYLAEAEARAGHGPDVGPRPVAHVGVVGAGTMGAGIATVFLRAGLAVTVVERGEAELALGRDRIAGQLDRAVAKGALDRQDADRAWGNLTAATDLGSLASADLVVEAVFEDFDLKAGVLTRLAGLVREDAVLASNTSYLDLDALAAATGRPEDVVGLHFFSPAPVMRLVEVVRGARTGDDVLATALALARRCGKLPVVAGVCDGFIGNRLYNAYRTQCEFMVEDGALPQEVDAALETFGFRMGPFSVWDMSGLDIAAAHRRDTAHRRAPGVRVPVLLDELCARGRLGRKTGAGWYHYPDGARRGHIDPAVTDLVLSIAAEHGIRRRTFTASEIVTRVLDTLTAEADALLAEGIAARASDIDVVLVNGYGFPRDRGGPLHWRRQAAD
ncbi:hypothetical protein FFT09_20180 [Saccharomonospora piscinae]|uniref:3-hydroxyacyl-CoA dehydrogenase n=1 Tax=Saccharomonospora piscinae TaxID=687388 RepID=UPI001106E324|nr:3-hydroxyacyl-CoA dehydrogenase [Saccharomonospora piscinae]TLW90664.1 hypothetical protein FFT09_20180 [Saccharomonospora piscinae]